MNTETTQRRKFVGDRHNSTFRWELYLTNEKAYVFDGYSMNVGQAEKHDKQALFQDCVARICNSGYLDKTYQMLWYKRGGALQHKGQDRILLEMYPTYFVVHDELQLDVASVNFLQRIYDAKLSGHPFEPLKLLPPRESKRDFEAIDFTFSLQRFPTEDILVEHCKQLVNKYPYKRVEAWWRACKVNYSDAPAIQRPPVAYRPAPPTGQQQASQFHQPAVNHQRPDNHREAGRNTPNMAPAATPLDPDNQQTANNAKQAINNLSSLYTRAK
ncbi:hypothetical protein [Spirosoma spitsbergense]|uniref:hypothetical protein n=1 Tax=Spirosoma spitsbergense TaxID=431554 RepID=UPI00035D5AE2|nr:hypothetical protein [Spirosoma spitsbergense]